MRINITSFVLNEDPFNYSASQAERGENAGRDTWNNAKSLASGHQLLDTPEKLEALREHVKGYGAWEEKEVDAWDAIECNALFIQLISGDMREAGMDEAHLEDFDWDQYEEDASAGRISGRILCGNDGQIYFNLGD